MRKTAGAAVLMAVMIVSTGFGAGEKGFDMVIQKGHYSYVYLDFSKDGKYIYSGSDKIIIIRTLEGQIIKEFEGHAAMINGIVVAPDNKKFVTISNDKTVKIWNMQGDLLQTLTHAKSITQVAISPDGRYIATGEYDFCNRDLCNTLRIWTFDGKEFYREGVHNMSIGRLLFTRDSRYLLSCSADKTIKIWDVNGKKLHRTIQSSQDATDIALTEDNKIVSVYYAGKIIEIWNFDGTLNKTLVNDRQPYRLLQNPERDRFMHYSQYGISILDYNGKKLKDLFPYEVNPMNSLTRYSARFGFYSLVRHPQKNIYAAGLDDKADYDIVLFDGDLNVVSRMKKMSSSIMDIALVPGTDTFFTGNSDMILMRWKMNTLSGVPLETAYERNVQAVKLAISRDGKHLASTRGQIGSGDYWVDLHSLDGGQSRFFGKKIDVKYKETGANWIYSLAFHPQNDKIFVGCTDGFTRLYTLDNKLVKTMDCEQYNTYEILVSADGRYVMTNNLRAIFLWDDKGNRIKTVYKSKGDPDSVDSLAYNVKDDQFVSVSKDGFRFFSKTGNLIRQVKREMPGDWMFKTCLDISPDGKLFAINNDRGDIQILDEKLNVLKSIKGHTSKINRLSFTAGSKKIISVGNDSRTILWNIETNAKATMLSRGNDWIVYDDDGYFDASKDGGDMVMMVKDFKGYGMDQFAVKNNRPDILLKNMRLGNQGVIDHFYDQYQKRIKRLGISESDLSSDLHVPQTVITESKVQGNTATVRFAVSDSLYALKLYNVYVNDVPLYGASGRSLKTKTETITENFELTPGKNKIEVTCINEKGAESLRALTYADSTVSTTGNLYFIGFGVSQYRDPSLALRFADKDAKDMSETLSKMKGKYKNIYAKTYLNEEVTTENIRGARSLLKDSRPEDTFILFIAGHGLHDNDRASTYYYLTYNTAVNNLSGTAADFGLIEDLLQGIAPRNKLFLMDTCESGEVDDAVRKNFFSMADLRGIKARTTRGLSVVKKDSGKRSYLFEKDRYIYNDLQRRSGAIVYSSSRGGEFSYESEKIGNGFFTYEILRAMTGNDADKNHDGMVTVDELRSYVTKAVSDLSGGLQNPTVDRDNLFQKFGMPVIK